MEDVVNFNYYTAVMTNKKANDTLYDSKEYSEKYLEVFSHLPVR